MAVPSTGSLRLGILTLLRTVNAAYFYVHEGAERCFVETVAEHQVLTVKYKTLDNPGVTCDLVFKDPRKTHVFSKRIDPHVDASGKAAYMTQKRGEHQICVVCKGSRWFTTQALKWEVSVDVGDTEFISSPATRKDLTGVERTVSAVLARLEAINAENEYEKSTEVEFRDTSERVNSRVVLFALLIMLFEAVLCAWQILHLKGFFHSQKLF